MGTKFFVIWNDALEQLIEQLNLVVGEVVGIQQVMRLDVDDEKIAELVETILTAGKIGFEKVGALTLPSPKGRGEKKAASSMVQADVDPSTYPKEGEGKKCVICGKPVKGKQQVCGTECAKERQRRYQQASDARKNGAKAGAQDPFRPEPSDSGIWPQGGNAGKTIDG